MSEHYSVLLEESIQFLAIKADGIYVDGTLGRAGHSQAILKQLTTGHLYAFDKDQTAIEKSQVILDKISKNYTIIHDGFETLWQHLEAKGIHQIDGLLLDIGVSSPQFDDASRGFSYRYDAPLDMRMDKRQLKTAYHVVNEYEFHDLLRVIQQYGEEMYAKSIARKIEQRRQIKPIETTFELVDVIRSALPAKVLNSKGHPAKKTFQALRIEVNNELHVLQTTLEQTIPKLRVDGRICVITFHSLEDRIVKQVFRKYTKAAKVDKRIPVLPNMMEAVGYEEVVRKPIYAKASELAENRRSHSAKLRVLRKVK